MPSNLFRKRLNENLRELRSGRRFDTPNVRRRRAEYLAAAGLNCGDPDCVEWLLDALTDADARSGGRPKVWSWFRLSCLLLEYLRKRLSLPDASDETILGELRKHNPHWSRFTVETLRRQLARARDETMNGLLRDVLASVPEHVPMLYENKLWRGGPDWPELPDRWDEAARQ